MAICRHHYFKVERLGWIESFPPVGRNTNHAWTYGTVVRVLTGLPAPAGRRLGFFGAGGVKASTSVRLSRMSAVASRTASRTLRRMQVASSAQSSQRRYAVTLAHGLSASGPSITRITSANQILSGERPSA